LKEVLSLPRVLARRAGGPIRSDIDLRMMRD